MQPDRFVAIEQRQMEYVSAQPPRNGREIYHGIGSGGGVPGPVLPPPLFDQTEIRYTSRKSLSSTASHHAQEFNYALFNLPRVHFPEAPDFIHAIGSGRVQRQQFPQTGFYAFRARRSELVHKLCNKRKAQHGGDCSALDQCNGYRHG
jgi:hypothetical protein